ncbi:hypothetical protein CAOG_009472 [Capsaspora owczarzaki ATCC 30864]|uniref:Uncharacterized protein n=1 Tax=Capsaspora owczarzaki (strain ATCC 30864) TaxID=595528 RepID=A0A0D2WLE3_CAPO3|nr:hypothetical protein CAOG_009472 [Capsaspora owczarzaki ATCC 30864]
MRHFACCGFIKKAFGVGVVWSCQRGTSFRETASSEVWRVLLSSWTIKSKDDTRLTTKSLFVTGRGGGGKGGGKSIQGANRDLPVLNLNLTVHASNHSTATNKSKTHTTIH